LIYIVENLISPLWSLSKYWLKFGTSQFTTASLMKVHPHASCPKPYGRNWVPLSYMNRGQWVEPQANLKMVVANGSMEGFVINKDTSCPILILHQHNWDPTR
jgi:hypothetical protein